MDSEADVLRSSLFFVFAHIYADSFVNKDEVALAVTIDIANAFNTIPWRIIGKALLRHKVPAYLYDIIGAYFRERTLSYYDQTVVL